MLMCFKRSFSIIKRKRFIPYKPMLWRDGSGNIIRCYVMIVIFVCIFYLFNYLFIILLICILLFLVTLFLQPSGPQLFS